MCGVWRENKTRTIQKNYFTARTRPGSSSAGRGGVTSLTLTGLEVALRYRGDISRCIQGVFPPHGRFFGCGSVRCRRHAEIAGRDRDARDSNRGFGPFIHEGPGVPGGAPDRWGWCQWCQVRSVVVLLVCLPLRVHGSVVLCVEAAAPTATDQTIGKRSGWLEGPSGFCSARRATPPGSL